MIAIGRALRRLSQAAGRLPPRLRLIMLVAAGFLIDAYALGSALAYDQLGRTVQDPGHLHALWRSEWLLNPLRTLGALLHPTTELEHAVANAFWLLHLAAAAGITYFLANRRPRYARPDPTPGYGSHGTAVWATERDLRKTLKSAGPGLIVGKAGGRYLIHPPDRTLLHNQLAVVFGGSGSRKTRTWVMPNTLHEAVQPPGHRASLVLTDPKAEIYAKAAHVLRKHGYTVQVLNFLDMDHSDRWNPLDYVHSTTDAADLAANIVANTVNPNKPVKGDPFWDMAEQNTITALILYVKRHCQAELQHMASVLELGTEPDPASLDAIFLALEKNDPARRFYRTFLRAEEKVRSGITAGLGSRLQLWNSDEITALTAASDFDLKDLGKGEQPTALFLLIPDSKPTFAPVLAIFWQQVFQVLYAEADRHGGELPRRVRCRMDELANCGYIPHFEQKLSTMRSRGVSVEMILQSVDQLKSRYPQTWSELLANCDTWLYLGGNDLETARYISTKLGTGTIRVHGAGSSTSDRSGSVSDNLSYTGRPLMTPDECLRLDPDLAILLRKGALPALVRKTDYTEHPAAREVQVLDHHQYTGRPRETPAVVDTAALIAGLHNAGAAAAAEGGSDAEGTPEATAPGHQAGATDFVDGS